jgi:hypothetical protein
MKQYTMQNKQNPSLMKDQGKLKENNQVWAHLGKMGKYWFNKKKQ